LTNLIENYEIIVGQGVSQSKSITSWTPVTESEEEKKNLKIMKKILEENEEEEIFKKR
jgi:hypothetical protein